MSSSYRTPGLIITDHEFQLPLDHTDPHSRSITVFAREVARPDGQERPFLVFFQGGPGFEAPRPLTAQQPAWLPRALQDFRVLLLDQRGTGRSSPIGLLSGMTPAEQAAYLRHFRADSIVRDAEAIRQALGVERWSVLGQSFGGFCVTTYLSSAPEGLREAFITGGLPALGHHPDEVYHATYARVLERNKRFYERYPQNRQRVTELLTYLEGEDVRLPGGDRLTARRFRQLGHLLGMSDGLERLHYLLESPFTSPAFLYDVQSALSFGRNPVYAVLHEACWADACISGWSAQRVMPEAFAAPEMLTGEMVFPWMFEEYAALRPLRDAAELLAREPWGALYDATRLRKNSVPLAAAVYAEDMYVERSFSEETAALIGGARVWLTNEYEHDGLRVDGERVLGRLIDLTRGGV
ncbi:alpha/beta fold hydrolase [Deinococcus peraridilitoris]|uniref:Putative hydrolase or acyltransferase of alpha/beta superfamily n=1 Tax=Deinococcus peraridilitoris (strain DSM 19664 / LMG 22246 / CIP 109416 / KR-200) TaxID=937777 RepID=K9ZYR8_DEIPD|nr:alpha/beta fold hydrolase [Deinococcus peraridilitoris]AFZ66726.1 putative hydrolase or acyltransferase of alpha/beta superfamily [Deinococcus peraridilitoris DSM 19664]